MIQRIESLVGQRKTFAIETTLATRSYAALVHKVHDLGYNVVLLFFWLPSPEIAVKRVAKRVSEGGHNIPSETIYRRYRLGLQNFFEIFIDIVDSWSFYDNLNTPVELANDDEIFQSETFNGIKQSCLNRKKKI